MTRKEVRRRIEELGIIPAARECRSEEDVQFAAEAVAEAGIPILEISLTQPGAIEIISRLTVRFPEIIVGAGSVVEVEAARRCLEAGARFVTSDGLDSETSAFVLSQDVVAIPGTLTPTGVIAAWKLRPDFVKVVPCGHIGGHKYLHSLKANFPDVPFVAAGGVTQRSAFDFIRAGADALGVGAELIPREAVRRKDAGQIAELSRRFLRAVNNAREQFGRS